MGWGCQSCKIKTQTKGMFNLCKSVKLDSLSSSFTSISFLINTSLIFITFNNKSNTTGATSGAETAYPPRAPEFTPGFYWGSCYLIFSFVCNVL